MGISKFPGSERYSFLEEAMGTESNLPKTTFDCYKGLVRHWRLHSMLLKSLSAWPPDYCT